MSETIEERWPKRWHCVEARDNEYAEQSGPGKPIFAVRNGVNIGTVDLCPKCYETFDHHAQPAQPPFTQCQRVRTKDGRVLDVSRCEKRVVHGKLRWVVDDLNGERAFADDCELFEGVQPEVRYACSKLAAVGDTVRIRSDDGTRYRVIRVMNDGIVELADRDSSVYGTIHVSHLEFVPDVTLNQPRDFPLDPVCELELEQTRQRLAVAMALLGQCDNRLFLVGKLELRRKQSGWSVFDPVANMFDDLRFADPIAAYQRAKDLLEAFGKEAGAT